MASSFYSNSQHIDFDSVLAMDDQGMVSMFQAFMASGLAGSLGCPAVIYEAALVDLFENASVREGVIISTVAGQLVEISEEWLAESFDLPVDGLGDLPEIPKDVIFDARSIKRPAVDVGAAVAKKKRTIKKKSVTSHSTLEMVAVAQEIVPLQMIEPCPDVPAVEDHVEQPAAEEGISVDQPVEVGVGEVAAEIDASADRDKPADTNEESQWFYLTHEELIKWAAERIITSPADTDEEIKAEKPVFKSVEAVESVLEVEEAAADKDFLVVDDPDTVINQVLHQLDAISADKDVKSGTGAETWFDRALDEMIRKDEGAETMDVDNAGGDQQKLPEDILLTIPVDVPLPSAGMEITKIIMGKEIKIPEVTERTWFLNSLPKIPADHKGKAILVEKDPIKCNPAKEHLFFICADIDMLVNLRAKVIDEVAQFFNYFSLKKLATINIEEMYKKEEQFLSWGETESPQVAIQLKLYILLKYREVLVRKFLESWRSNFVPGQGSSVIDLRVIDLLSDIHLFVLEELTKEARAHGLTWKKTCCSKIFEGSPRDRGAVIARSNTNTRSFCWIRTMKKVNGTWVIEPCADQWVTIPRPILSSEIPRQRQYDDSLPPVNNFFNTLTNRWADICLEVVEFCTSKRLLPVGSLNFCRALEFVVPDSSFDSRPPTVFALRFSRFCIVYIQYSFFSRLTTADITDFLSSIALNRTAFRSEQISQNIVSVSPSVQPFYRSRLMNLKVAFPPGCIRLNKVFDSLREQAAVFKNLFQEERQEGRTIDDVQTLRFNEFRKNILAQNASIFTGLADVRKEVQEVNAKVDIIVSRVNDVRKNVEETKEALSHQLMEFQIQAQANQNILHAQLSELVNYINRGSADKKGESSSRGPQQPPTVQNPGSGQFLSVEQAAELVREADRRESDRLERERARERRERRLSGSGSYKRRRGQ
ncbi:hypothetical protein F511_33630 [Dorcoceras hygrometricum]|uniref:Dystroglycan-like n=1 Tax=Dorcoceras hygrometricum TaxID=472368 RepID=A0A2Z7BYH7_9LAMI|nr:hypothetical protein F511_33630 [Dorcoceras hygrometricum]